jgi:phytoene synthase
MADIANLVRRHDPDRFLACLFAPPDKREALFVLTAFNHELARTREVTSQPMLGLIRLQWWRETVNGTRRRHEVAGPLGDLLDAGQLDRGDLLSMIEAREAECDEEMADLASWHRYLAGCAGGWAVAAGRALGADIVQLTRLRRLGAAYGVAGQLGSVAMLATHQRCMLPVDILASHNLSPFHILQNPNAADQVRPALVAEGLALWEAGRGKMPRSVIAAALPAVLAQRDLIRGSRHRGIGDKLAVMSAFARGRI